MIAMQVVVRESYYGKRSIFHTESQDLGAAVAARTIDANAHGECQASTGHDFSRDMDRNDRHSNRYSLPLANDESESSRLSSHRSSITMSASTSTSASSAGQALR